MVRDGDEPSRFVVELAAVHDVAGGVAAVVAGLVGIELYGLGGALLAIAIVAFAAAVAGELRQEQPGPAEVGDLVERACTGISA